VFDSFIATESAEGTELQMRRKDGSTIDVVLNVSPVRDGDGNLVHRRSAWHDITARKQAAAQLEVHNRDLETLFHVISHDLREPLRAIEGFASIVHDRYGDRLDEKGRDFLTRVIRAARRLDDLIEDMCELSRVRRSASSRRMVRGQVIVQKALQQLEDRILECGASVHVEPDLPEIWANETWAIQAVYNLIANALKFTRQDSKPEIEIGAYRPEPGSIDQQGLVVRDRGPGVDPEHAERIFQLFQRAVGREWPGTGAGLAIVKQVADRHGGRAWVRSRAGGGSEFVITFSTAAPRDAAASRSERSKVRT
jgi:signal transduction histidine kinase